MQWLSLLADVIGILGGIFALFAWLQSREVSKQLAAERHRKDKKIRVVLSYGGDELELPVEIRRADFTRAEILGRLGMIPMKEKGQRFVLTHLNTPEFLRRINEIADGSEASTLSIPCTREEFKQFDLG
jgi:hypothetical protein